MAQPVIQPVNISASALIHTGPGKIYSIVVNSHTSGTLKVWDSTTAAGKVIFNTITVVAGSGVVFTFSNGANFTTGCFITIGGTADITCLISELNG